MGSTADTLVRWFQLRAQETPERLYTRFLFPERDPAEATFGDTERRARKFAGLCAAHGVRKGDVVLVILPHGEDLMVAYLGVMWLGAIPAFLPSLNAKLDPARYYRNLALLTETTRPLAILTDRGLEGALGELLSGAADGPVMVAAEAAEDAHPAGEPTAHGPEDAALIQYSSGSTGLQKGAVLSHRAVLAEMRGVESFFEMTSEENSFLTWVPLYHDWGLVCVALHAIELGTDCTLISPIHWVTRPVVAVEAIDRYRPTVYYQPNFAFNYMTRKITDEEMEGLDLSSLRLCCNGAEPCFYDSHKMFADRFRAWGFRPESLGIVYGMAEVTNSVFAAGHKEPIRVDRIDRQVLQAEGWAEPVGEEHPDLVRMLGVGRPLEGTEFRIVDDDLVEVPERHVGEVEIRSRAAYDGYYRNPEATAQADHDGWYLTGDMGYRVGEILFITGRKSDMIIVGGVNIYPQDVEAIVSEHPAVVAGRVAAVGVDDPELGTQKLGVMVESRSTDPEELREIARFIRAEVPLRLGVTVEEIHHVPYRWLIKTSSGKIARLPNYRRLTTEAPEWVREGIGV